MTDVVIYETADGEGAPFTREAEVAWRGLAAAAEPLAADYDPKVLVHAAAVFCHLTADTGGAEAPAGLLDLLPGQARLLAMRALAIAILQKLVGDGEEGQM